MIAELISNNSDCKKHKKVSIFREYTSRERPNLRIVFLGVDVDVDSYIAVEH